MIFPWPYPCPVCYGEMQVEITIVKNRTVKRMFCECGANVTHKAEYTAGDELGPAGGKISRERVKFYTVLNCAVCGYTLTGKQKRFCSKRCNMRFIRNGNIR